MSKESLVQRILCSHARVDMQAVRTGFLSQDHWGDLVNAAGKMSTAPLFIDDTPGLNVLELRAKARRLKSQHNIGMIILDYMQLMQAAGSRGESRQRLTTQGRCLASRLSQLQRFWEGCRSEHLGRRH